MHVERPATAISKALTSAAAPRLAVLLGGALNGFMVRIAERLGEGGTPPILLGMSPFELIALAVATHIIAVGTPEPRTVSLASFVPEVLAALALLLPSSAVSWLVVAIYAAWRGWTGTAETRLGYTLFAALAATALWSAVLFRMVAAPVTALDAHMVATVLGQFMPGITQTGNVVGTAGAHELVVMSACSTLDGLPKAMLGLAATASLAGVITLSRLAVWAPLLATAYAIANIARLSVMAISHDLYLMAHGGIGANIFDAATVGVMLLLVFSVRPD